MAKVFCVLILFVFVSNCQVIKNVNLVNYRNYFEQFAEQFVRIIEDKNWSNLELPDMRQDVSSTMFGQTLSGTVKYTNGFVVSIESIDIPTGSMAQNFVSPNATFATVEVSGSIRMVDVTVGFDVEADVNNKKTHYTGVTTFSRINANFGIIKDLYTNKITATSTISVPWNATAMTYLPTDFLTDLLTSTYVVSSANNGIVAWAQVFQPIAEDVAKNKVAFPEICYNCPIV